MPVYTLWNCVYAEVSRSSDNQGTNTLLNSR